VMEHVGVVHPLQTCIEYPLNGSSMVYDILIPISSEYVSDSDFSVIRVQ